MRATVDPAFLEEPSDSEAGAQPVMIEDAPSRTWLLRGRFKFSPDPRRRFGKHSHARGLLASDLPSGPSSTGIWTDLVSALHRHTAAGGLSRLPEDERRLLTLAYLEGHSNREIAGMLNVSARTVGRRLSKALERLEKGLLWTSTWISAVALLFLAGVSHRAGLAWRSAAATAGGSDRQAALLLAAASAASAIAIGVVVTSPGSSGLFRPSTPAAINIGPLALRAPAGTPHSIIAANGGVTSTLMAGRPAGPAAAAAGSAAAAGHPGCGGNPTSAAPQVPVGPRGTSPGAPVTHPTAGGCGPHSGA